MKCLQKRFKRAVFPLCPKPPSYMSNGSASGGFCSLTAKANFALGSMNRRTATPKSPDRHRRSNKSVSSISHLYSKRSRRSPSSSSYRIGASSAHGDASVGSSLRWVRRSERFGIIVGEPPGIFPITWRPRHNTGNYYRDHARHFAGITSRSRMVRHTFLWPISRAVDFPHNPPHSSDLQRQKP
jgi:hypothetical protein